MTLGHPHGQIYAYPFITPRTALMLRSVAAHRTRTGGANLFDDVARRANCADGAGSCCETEHWVAFVPYAAHWPYEVHLYPQAPGAGPARARRGRAHRVPHRSIWNS